MIRVGVVGAAGGWAGGLPRGRRRPRTSSSSPPSTRRTPATGRRGRSRSRTTLDALHRRRRAEVAVEFTRPDAVPRNIALVRRARRPRRRRHDGVRAATPRWARAAATSACSSLPNFAIGAVLMHAVRRARRPGTCRTPRSSSSITTDKPDAPSGTAMATARRMAAARDRGRDAGCSGASVSRAPRGADVDGDPRPLGPPARPGRASGGHPGRARADAHDPPRLH